MKAEMSNEVCRRCGRNDLTPSDFYYSKGKRVSGCKKCQNEYGKKYRANMSDYQRQSLKKYMAEYEKKYRRGGNRKKYLKEYSLRPEAKEKNKARVKRYYEANKHKLNLKYRDKRIARQIEKSRNTPKKPRLPHPCEIILVFSLKINGMQNDKIAERLRKTKSYISHITNRRVGKSVPIHYELIRMSQQVNNMHRACNSNLFRSKLNTTHSNPA